MNLWTKWGRIHLGTFYPVNSSLFFRKRKFKHFPERKRALWNRLTATWVHGKKPSNEAITATHPPLFLAHTYPYKGRQAVGGCRTYLDISLMVISSFSSCSRFTQMGASRPIDRRHRHRVEMQATWLNMKNGCLKTTRREAHSTPCQNATPSLSVKKTVPPFRLLCSPHLQQFFSRSVPGCSRSWQCLFWPQQIVVIGSSLLLSWNFGIPSILVLVLRSSKRHVENPDSQLKQVQKQSLFQA